MHASRSFRVARCWRAARRLPDDAPVVEQLDTETGATVARLGNPSSSIAKLSCKEAAGRFAFIGPFETNQMGTRESFVWVAVPVEPAADAVPIVEVNGKALALGAPGAAADFAGLHKSPYKIPTPWSVDVLLQGRRRRSSRRSARRTSINVRVLEPGKDGPVKSAVRGSKPIPLRISTPA